METITTKSSAGKRGETIRSDCYFEIELTKSGGINLELKSKVKNLYGDSINNQVNELCKFFNLKNAQILLEDSGALPFVIAARFELAVKRLFPDLEREYHLPVSAKSAYTSSKDRLSRSRLYLHCNETKFFTNAGL
ncbi:MAG: citrate lyase ACP, partial [Ignavibacteriaceae bacterium]|nr:citrate lyase ACP [Ignavibacteriaceae bacterium]